MGAITKFIQDEILGDEPVVILNHHCLHEFDENLDKVIEDTLRNQNLMGKNMSAIYFDKNQSNEVLNSKSTQINYWSYSSEYVTHPLKPIPKFLRILIIDDASGCFMSSWDFYSLVEIMSKKYPKYETLLNTVKTCLNRIYGYHISEPKE